LIRPILTYPDERLLAPTVPVQDVDDDVRQLIVDLGETMAAADGAGLAAPQVGVSVRVFVIAADVAGLVEETPQAFINPEITWLSQEAAVGKEGCLSFPHFYTAVPRYTSVHVRALGSDGQLFEAHAEGLYARAIQHEHDHLLGKLLIDRAIAENT
jgi:peptide deformylase